TEDRGEEARLDFAEHHIAVRHRERTAAPVAGGTGIGPGRIGPHPITGAIEMTNRPAASGDGVDGDHRCAQSYTGHLGIEAAFHRAPVRTGEMRDIGRGTTHVEADDAVETG